MLQALQFLLVEKLNLAPLRSLCDVDTTGQEFNPKLASAISPLGEGAVG